MKKIKKSEFQMMTPVKRVEFIRSILAEHKGKFFSATWIKKNGELRKASGKELHRASLKGGELKFDPKSRGLIQYYDVNSKGWRMINTGTIEKFKAGGKIYID